MDGLEPVYVLGTGKPKIGGITWEEAHKLLRGSRGVNLMSGDVVEVVPPFDLSGSTALVGATNLFQILCLLMEAVNGHD